MESNLETDLKSTNKMYAHWSIDYTSRNLSQRNIHAKMYKELLKKAKPKSKRSKSKINKSKVQTKYLLITNWLNYRTLHSHFRTIHTGEVKSYSKVFSPEVC